MAVGYFSFQPVDDVHSGAPKEGGSPPNMEPIVILVMVVVVVVVGPPWVPWGDHAVQDVVAVSGSQWGGCSR